MANLTEMQRLERARIEGWSDAQLINHWIETLCARQGGGDLLLGPRRYEIDEPIVLRSGIRLRGEGAVVTVLAATSSLDGPVIISENAEALEAADAWFASEGVPTRFSISDLMIDGAEGGIGSAVGSGCGMYLYAKGFEIQGVQISHMKRHGLVSTGSARGGQEVWLDEPEALFDVRISRCGGDGFIMRGPHDSIIRSAIIALCKGRGLAVETDGKYNGACDIEFCHAYGTDGIAIDLQAKIKAGFLQGDTGRGAGVRIGGSNKTYIDRIECFKTRGSAEDYALDIVAPYTQIGLARVRADWGASGVRIAAPGCQIGQIDIDGQRNTGGPLADTENDTTALYVRSAHSRIGSVNIRNFPKGHGIVLERGIAGVDIAGTTRACSTHLVAHDQRGTDLRLNMVLSEGESYTASPSSADVFALRTLSGG